MRKYQLREEVPNAASEELSFYPDIVKQLLYTRGITTLQDADVFLNPSYDNHTHDPFLIAGMEKAVDRILKAITNNEVICIWTDYDHDGIPAGAIIYDFFKKIGFENFRNYIPNRRLEGYGVNPTGIESLAKDGVKLIITADVGITDVEAVKRANELGIDVIVTDHHLPGEVLPEAFVILNSKQEHCKYPDDMLCGAGVAFKLVQALIIRGGFREKIGAGWEKWLLDLVGISTVADMVPLVKENRVLAHFGLKVLRKTRRPGLQKLFREAGVQQPFISEDDIGFSIAPRINAASRMDDPYVAFNLLSTADEGRAGALAKQLNELNDVRKGIAGSMAKEMKHSIASKEAIPSVIVMGNPKWSPALLGVAASNLVEEYNRPVFLWGKEGSEKLKGSCRSDGSVNLVSMMAQVRPGVLTQFGGHAFSGGFAVSYDEIYDLENHLVEAYEKVKSEKQEAVILVDKILSLDEINWKLWDNISLLAPFGIGNPKPIFMFERIIPEKVRSFGKKGEHLEVTFRKDSGDFIRAIEFFSSRPIKEAEPITLIANLEKSTFGRYPELRLRIIDII